MSYCHAYMMCIISAQYTVGGAESSGQLDRKETRSDYSVTHCELRVCICETIVISAHSPYESLEIYETPLAAKYFILYTNT